MPCLSLVTFFNWLAFAYDNISIIFFQRHVEGSCGNLVSFYCLNVNTGALLFLCIPLTSLLLRSFFACSTKFFTSFYFFKYVIRFIISLKFLYFCGFFSLSLSQLSVSSTEAFIVPVFSLLRGSCLIILFAPHS